MVVKFAYASCRNVIRYPDDQFDRIWAPLDDESNAQLPNVSISNSPDNTTRADVYYVPPKIMKDGWLFAYPNNRVSASLYPENRNIYFQTQGDYAYTVLYSEHLTTSDSEVYTISISLDGFSEATSMNFTNKATMLASPNFILSSNYLNLIMNLSSGVTLNDGPTMNACEVYSQSNFNFSTTSTEDGTETSSNVNPFEPLDCYAESVKFLVMGF